VKLNNYDTSVLASVWDAFERIATEFPGDPGVVITLQYHDWYSLQCLQLSERLE
jgi:hypothetical protein